MQDEITIEDSSKLEITNQEAKIAGQSLALYTIQSSAVRKMEALGIEVNASGVIRVADGLTFMTAECLANAMLRLTEQCAVATGKDLQDIARTLGYVAGAMAKQTKGLKDAAVPIVNRNGGQGSGNGFKPGAVVDVQSTMIRTDLK